MLAIFNRTASVFKSK
jgi:hypothetical protein